MYSMPTEKCNKYAQNKPILHFFQYQVISFRCYSRTTDLQSVGYDYGTLNCKRSATLEKGEDNPESLMLRVNDCARKFST